ncbi:MAG: hypothetical protein QOI66_963 [Myxococcales bacterium]|jgi:hypothetical protein|nr:hypothetical protein [Myxococcales bacterium]
MLMADAVDRQLLANPLITAQRMEAGAVLMDAATGECFELNRVGAEVWEQIASGGDMTKVVTVLANRYGVAEARISADIAKLIDEMLARGLVRLK